MREGGMELRRSNRRAFMRDAVAVAATATLLKPGSALLGRAPAAEPGLQPIRLGGPSFATSEDPEALALAHRKLGGWIVSCHAKDLTWEVEMNVHFREVAPGKGSLDYSTYLKRLAELPQNAPLMLEHLSTAEEYTAAREHIFEVGHKGGLSFG